MKSLVGYKFGDTDKLARQAGKDKKKSHEPKFVPRLRYVRNHHGIVDVHSQPNRSIRRRSAAMERTGYHDMTTGDWVPGWRAKLKSKVRKASIQREMLTGKSPRPTKFPASITPPYGSHKINPNFKLSGRNMPQFSENRKQRRQQRKQE
jgi:hypothetical protein